MTNMLAITNLAGKLPFARFSASFVAEEKNALDTIVTVVTGVFKDIGSPIFDLITNLILMVFRWVLTIIDLGFVLIRQMGGINIDYSSMDQLKKTIGNDIIFKFIFDSQVTEILKGLLILAIVVIIVFGIIAIIKSEFSAAFDTSNSGEIKNDKWPIWKRIFQSLFLLVFVPVVFIGGIILSNALLQTLVNAVSSGNSLSIGSQIFMASSYDANAYRIYAEANKKIPITYNFNQIKDYTAVTNWDTSGSVKQMAEVMEKYKQADEWAQGFSTFTMFYLDTFLEMDAVDEIQQYAGATANPYNDAYDTGIKTYKYEYFVNADLLDYLMKYNEPIHIVSVEDVYEKGQAAGVNFNIVPSADSYEFYVNYVDEADAIKYTHKKGSTDEAYGAVYLMCLEKSVDYAISGGTETRHYYEPITNQNSKFKSGYLEDNQYVVAKGFFEDGKYPTAIKESNGKIDFYREKLNVPTFGSFFPHISYELPEGATEMPGMKILKSAVQLFTGINVNDFVPYVYFDLDIRNLFTKTRITVASLDAGEYYLDYGFTSDGMALHYVYQQLNINYVILILASILILKNILKAFFGLLKRSVDIMFLYLVYPAAIATIPLYESSSFKNWIKKMTSKVLSLFGLMIGINLALLLVPIAMEIEIFTPQDLQNTIFGFIPNMGAAVLNVLFQLLFTLVGISFIFQVTGIVQEFVTSAPDIISEGGSVIEGTTKIYKKAAAVISGKALVDKVKSVKNVTGYRDEGGTYHAGWIPGSAAIGMIDQWKETRYGMKKNDERAEKMKGDAKAELETAKQKAEQNKADKKQKKQEKKQQSQNNNSTTPNSGAGNPPPAGGTPPAQNNGTPPPPTNSGGGTTPSP